MTPPGHHTATGWGSLSNAAQLCCHETLSKLGCHLASLIFKSSLKLWAEQSCDIYASTCPPHLSATHFLRRSYFYPRCDDVHNFHFNPYSRADGWRAYVPARPDCLSCEGVLISVTRLSNPPPQPLINRNKSRLLYVTRDGCTFISLFMRYNLNTWAGVINADTHSDAGSLLGKSTTARLYAQPQAPLICIIFSLFTKETAKRGKYIPQLNKCSVLTLSVSDEPLNSPCFLFTQAWKALLCSLVIL